jgi:hypothetical protein
MYAAALLAIIPGTIVCLLPVLFVSLFSFDQLVRFQHKAFNAEWERDGRPIGYFWHPSGGSVFARSRVNFKWLFATPDWMRKDDRAVNLLNRRRICFVVWNVGMLAVFCMVVAFFLSNLTPDAMPPNKVRAQNGVTFGVV